MKFKKQQEQIDMLIELVNNLVEREGERIKYERKISPTLTMYDQRLESIEDFLDRNFGMEEDERTIN